MLKLRTWQPATCSGQSEFQREMVWGTKENWKALVHANGCYNWKEFILKLSGICLGVKIQKSHWGSDAGHEWFRIVQWRRKMLGDRGAASGSSSSSSRTVGWLLSLDKRNEYRSDKHRLATKQEKHSPRTEEVYWWKNLSVSVPSVSAEQQSIRLCAITSCRAA